MRKGCREARRWGKGGWEVGGCEGEVSTLATRLSSQSEKGYVLMVPGLDPGALALKEDLFLPSLTPRTLERLEVTFFIVTAR